MNQLDVRMSFAIIFLFSLGLGACSSAPTEIKMASAQLKSRSNSTTEGHLHFHQVGKKVHVAYELKNLAPKSKHGFHLHEKGDCSAPDASSAGGHWNPGGHSHGGITSAIRHAGDLGNIEANELGIAKGELTLDNLEVKSVIGLSAIVHDKADDEKTNPSGNSGARISCGVIEQSN